MLESAKNWVGGPETNSPRPGKMSGVVQTQGLYQAKVGKGDIMTAQSDTKKKTPRQRQSQLPVEGIGGVKVDPEVGHAGEKNPFYVRLTYYQNFNHPNGGKEEVWTWKNHSATQKRSYKILEAGHARKNQTKTVPLGDLLKARIKEARGSLNLRRKTEKDRVTGKTRHVRKPNTRKRGRKVLQSDDYVGGKKRSKAPFDKATRAPLNGRKGREGVPFGKKKTSTLTEFLVFKLGKFSIERKEKGGKNDGESGKIKGEVNLATRDPHVCVTPTESFGTRGGRKRGSKMAKGAPRVKPVP